MDQKEILKKLISFNTVKDKDNREMMDWLSSFLSSLGFAVEEFTGKDKGKKGILARSKPDVSLGFLCHTDTVPAGPDWKTNPFSLEEKDGKLYGLGASDMKGGIAACLAAISQLDIKNAKKGVELIFTYDEEDDFSGIKDFMNHGRIGSKYVIVPEPTDARPMFAAKGYVELKLDIRGAAAHGSEPENGDNAIIKACEFISKFKEFFDDKIRPETNDAFPGARATYNIAKISGGDAINKVPDRCVLEMECRTIGPQQTQEIYKGVLEILSNMTASVQMDFPLPCFFAKNDGMKSFFENITGKKRGYVSFVTEANFFVNGLEAVILGPGPVTAHKDNEYIDSASLDALTEIYKKAIERYCF